MPRYSFFALCQLLEEEYDMSDFKQVLDTDLDEVWSHRFCEMPVLGPGLANRLVTITGIALSRVDADQTDIAFGDIYIKTDYRIRDQDHYKGIVDGNTSLLAATYVSLTSIASDDSTEVTFAVNTVSTSVDTVGRIQLHIQAALQGDATLSSIAYQANILIQKAET